MILEGLQLPLVILLKLFAEFLLGLEEASCFLVEFLDHLMLLLSSLLIDLQDLRLVSLSQLLNLFEVLLLSPHELGFFHGQLRLEF